MIKVFALLPKRADLSEERFYRHWNEVHAPLVLEHLSVKRYVHSRCLPQYCIPQLAPFPYAGADELWFDDFETAKRELEGPAYLEGRGKDEANFLDAAGPLWLFTRENVVISGPPVEKNTQITKILFCVKHKPGRSSAEFQDYWRNRHAPLVPGTPELDRYVQCHVVLDTFDPGQTNYDGVGELWCKDFAAFERCWSSPQLVKEQLPDTLNFVGPNAIGMIAEEVRILWP